MRYTWIVDPHLDHLDEVELDAFCSTVAGETHDDGVTFVTGDISTAGRLDDHVGWLAVACRGRLLYVLGNHDRWGGSVSGTGKLLAACSSPTSKDVFMDAVPHVVLPDGTYVVGDSGWYDGRNGQQGAPMLIMRDWFLVNEYVAADPRATSQAIADTCARTLERKLNDACRLGAERVIVITHVPPYPEAARYMGKPSDGVGLPWFTSRATGDALDRVAAANPRASFEVLCGHTHEHVHYRRARNLNVRTGAASYGAPSIVRWEPDLW